MSDLLSDLFIILDCCHAGSAIQEYKQRQFGAVDVLTACGFESTTPVFGEHCFTRNLVHQLRDDYTIEQTTEYIHAKLLQRLNSYVPLGGSGPRVSAIRFPLRGTKDNHTIRLICIPRLAVVAEGRTVPLLAGTRKRPSNIEQRGSTESAEQESGLPTIKRVVSKQDSDLCNLLVEAMQFENQYTRINSIRPVFSQTFQWIFNEDSGTGFTDWLKCEEKIYWITGKPGSGKSTMMKMIVDHPSTQNLLKPWAASRELHLVSHFFWMKGSMGQQSLFGFYRSLIIQMLLQWPELATVAANFLHDKAHIRVERDALTRKLSLPVYNALFKNLAAHYGTSHCLFIILDSLDECDDDDRLIFDFLDDVSVLKGVKVCVSSRPSRIFMFHILHKNHSHLRLQDLTRGDIEVFVHTMLNTSRSYAKFAQDDRVAARDLELDIVMKAAGVFLWVSLVVHRLLRFLDDGSSISDLRAAIHDDPPDLNALYYRMLSSIPAPSRTSASVILSMVRASQSLVYGTESLVYGTDTKTAEPLLTTIGLSISYMARADPRMVFETKLEPFSAEELQDLENYCDNQLHHSINKFLIADTRMERAGIQYELPGRLISFTHQSAREFLEQGEVSNWFMEHGDPNLDAKLLLLESAVIQIKRTSLDTMNVSTHEAVYHFPCWSLLDQAMRSAANVRPENVPKMVEILNELDSVMSAHIQKWSNNSISGHWSRLLPLGSLKLEDWADNFLALAVNYNVLEYVRHKLQFDDAAIEKSGRPLLDYATRSDFSSSVLVGMASLLLDHGADPNDTFAGESILERFLTFWQGSDHKRDILDSDYTRSVLSLLDRLEETAYRRQRDVLLSLNRRRFINTCFSLLRTVRDIILEIF